MRKFMNRLRLGKSKLKPLLICLTATISACAGAPKFPEVPLYETAYYVQEGNGIWVCGEYKITDPKRKKYEFVKDHPVQKCIGVFGFSKKDMPKVITWGEDTEAYYKGKCGK